MAIIKCKMCGGDMELSPDKTFGTCEYCGSVMTLPKVDDDQRAAQFNRGNHFRRQGEFDKALAVYERIVAEDDTDAEAHWCCALCRFGIEYVEDPATYEYIPTCHRASFDSFLEDVDYLAAVEHSDGITRRQYQKDGAKIAEVQRAILATSQKEEPFDVFICYKETDDETKERTRDSLDAQEIYYNLTQEGYRVFFARITLEDKAGTEYEPYIFAALNSAKVMVVVGEKAEYFSAVWVKNEWSRFLSLMRKDRTKLLLPCYKNVDPYDLPEQLGVLQSYDMGKIGFMQDLIRGIKKVLQKDEPKEAVKETVVVQQSPGGANITAQLKRGMQALEDRDWDAADGFFDKALDMDAECAEAFFGKALAAEKCSSGAELAEKRIAQAQPQAETLTACERDDARIEETVRKFAIPDFLSEKSIRDCFQFDNRSFVSCLNGWKNCITLEKAWWERTDRNLSRALRYAKGDTAREYTALKEKVMAALEANRAASEAEDAKTIAEITERYAEELEKSEQHASELYEAAVTKRKNEYDKYCKLQAKAKTVGELRTVCASFESAGFRGYEDCGERVKQCLAEIERLEKVEVEKRAAERAKARAKAEAEERQRITEEKIAAAAKKKKKVIISAAVVAVIAAVLLLTKVIIPDTNYKKALALESSGNTTSAIEFYVKAGTFKDSQERVCDLSLVRVPNLATNDSIYFGRYKGRLLNWTVVNDTDEYIVLVCNSVIEKMPYNNTEGSMKRDDSAFHNNEWVRCSLRQWLNEDFLLAFNDKEKALMIKTTVSGAGEVKSEAAIDDYVYIMSNYELNKAKSTAWSGAIAKKGIWLRGSSGSNGLGANHYPEGGLRRITEKLGVVPVICLGK